MDNFSAPVRYGSVHAKGGGGGGSVSPELKHVLCNLCVSLQKRILERKTLVRVCWSGKKTKSVPKTCKLESTNCRKIRGLWPLKKRLFCATVEEDTGKQELDSGMFCGGKKNKLGPKKVYDSKYCVGNLGFEAPKLTHVLCHC